MFDSKVKKYRIHSVNTYMRKLLQRPRDIPIHIRNVTTGLSNNLLVFVCYRNIFSLVGDSTMVRELIVDALLECYYHPVFRDTVG